MNRQCQRFKIHVSAFVCKLVTASKEEVDCVVKVEIKMPVKMAADELGDLCLALFAVRRHSEGIVSSANLGVEVLKLMQGAELDDVKPVWRHNVWAALEQVLCLIGRDLRHRGEDMCGMG